VPIRVDVRVARALEYRPKNFHIPIFHAVGFASPCSRPLLVEGHAETRKTPTPDDPLHTKTGVYPLKINVIEHIEHAKLAEINDEVIVFGVFAISTSFYSVVKVVDVFSLKKKFSTQSFSLLYQCNLEDALACRRCAHL
jgi:hypothetical protein